MKKFLLSFLRIVMRTIRQHPWLSFALALCLFGFFTFRVDAQVAKSNELNNQIRDLQKLWRDADSEMAACMKPAQEKQAEYHRKANEIRDELCDGGSFGNCRTPELLQKAKEKHKASLKRFDVHVTSYNPVKAQTDGSPCIGAAGVDLCKWTLEGRPIALSQDLVGRVPWKPFTYNETIFMESDVAQCNGYFVVLDTMNKKWKNKADIFNLLAKDNTSCKATIYKLDRVSRLITL